MKYWNFFKIMQLKKNILIREKILAIKKFTHQKFQILLVEKFRKLMI